MTGPDTYLLAALTPDASMRSVNARSIAEFFAHQYESRSYALEHLHQWLQPSKQPNVAPFGQRGHWWRKRGPKVLCDCDVTA